MIDTESLDKLAIAASDLHRVPLDRVEVRMIYRPDHGITCQWAVTIRIPARTWHVHAQGATLDEVVHGLAKDLGVRL